MVTFKICTFVYLNVDYHHQEHFFVGEWIDSRFQYDTRRGVKVLKFWNVCPLKTLIFGRSKHLKNSSKILANTFSDSLAILKPPGSLPVPITLSELWEWLFTFPSHNSLRKRTPLLIIDQICENDSFRKLFLFFENTFQYLSGISKDISVSRFRISIPAGHWESVTWGNMGKIFINDFSTFPSTLRRADLVNHTCSGGHFAHDTFFVTYHLNVEKFKFMQDSVSSSRIDPLTNKSI